MEFTDHVKEHFEKETFFKVGYEAGCLGYALYYSLTNLGLSCDILAPTTMLCSAKNKVVKNYKLDSRMIAQNLVNGTYKAVQPSEVIAYADRAVERMKRKFSHMIYSGKARNKSITAIARELACFIWGMSTGNISAY